MPHPDAPPEVTSPSHYYEYALVSKGLTDTERDPRVYELSVDQVRELGNEIIQRYQISGAREIERRNAEREHMLRAAEMGKLVLAGCTLEEAAVTVFGTSAYAITILGGLAHGLYRAYSLGHIYHDQVDKVLAKTFGHENNHKPTDEAILGIEPDASLFFRAAAEPRAAMPSRPEASASTPPVAERSLLPDERNTQRLAAVAEELEIELPDGMTLDELLGYLTPQAEHQFRQRYGLFPYTRAHSFTEISLAQNTTIDSAGSHVSIATRRLRQLAKKGVAGAKRAPHPPLETVATVLDSSPMTPHLEAFLRRILGLSPFSTPQFSDEASVAIGRAAGSGLYYKALALQDFERTRAKSQTDEDEIPEGQLTKENIQQLYRTIHAGWHAAGILQLRDPQTRSAAISQLRAQIRTAGRNRQTRREGGFVRHKKQGDEMSPPPAVAQEFDPARDTPEGRRELLKQQLLYATQLDPELADLLPILVREGEAALRNMVEAHKSFVPFIVLKYPVHTQGPDVLDNMIASGMVGLWKAALRYTPAANANFTTYAVYWIRSQIQEDYKRLRNMSSGHYKAIRQLENAYQRLSQQLLHEPQPAELAKEMQILEEKVREIYTWRERLRSVRHTDAGEGEVVWSAAPAPQTDRMLQKALADSLSIASLDADELRLIALAYGLPPYTTDYSIPEIATQTGLDTKEIEAKMKAAMNKMRRSPQVLTLLSEYRR